MPLIVDIEYSGPMTPHYRVTCVDGNDLVEYWTEDESKYVWQKTFKTEWGLARCIKRALKLK